MKTLSRKSGPCGPRVGAGGTAVDLLPSGGTITALRQAASVCKACDLWKNATQTVFGEGSSKSKIMFVGEQPGDQEDRAGHPFVGPAGRFSTKPWPRLALSVRKSTSQMS
jgi:uracil-DNA glycosylase